MADYTKIFTILGAHLKVLQKTETFLDHCRKSTLATHSKRLIDAAHDGTIDLESVAETRALVFLQDSVGPAVAGLHNDSGQQLELFQTVFFPILDEQLLIGQIDQELGPISYVYDDTLVDGEIAVQDRRGRFGALHRAMTADSQTIKGNVVVLGSLVASPANHGSATLVSSSGSDHTLGGSIAIEVNDETVGSETATVVLTVTRPLIADVITPGATFIGSDKVLTFGKSFRDGPTGVNLLVNAGSVVESGDDGNIMSAITIANVNATDIPNRKVFVEIEKTNFTTPPDTHTYVVKYFSDALHQNSLSPATSTVSGDNIGNEVVNYVSANGMTITFTFDRAAAFAHIPLGTADTNIILDPKTPRLGDKWTITVTNNEAGNFATKLARRYRASLPSVTNGLQTISDTLAATVTME